MKKTLFLLLIALQVQTIERVDLSGLSESRLSAELRADLQKLVGRPYNAQTVEALAQDIQVELPEYVAAATTQPGSQPDRIRVILVVARIADDPALQANINSRYIVDAIEFEGMKVRISDELNKEIQAMVGGNVNSSQLGSFGNRISAENRGLNAIVTWKLRRSSAPQHVKVVYDVRKAKNTISLSLSGGTYHSRQGISMPTFGANYTRAGVGTLSFTMKNSAEEFIERYAGYGLGYSIGSNAVRLNLNYSSYRAQWKTNTLVADQQSSQSPGLYRLRDTLSGSLNFSFTPSRSALINGSGGVEFNELQMQTPRLGFQKSNAITGSLRSSYVRRSNMESHNWDTSYRISAGTAAIDSDFIYARHEARAGYAYVRNPHSIEVDFLAGKITGNAPMIERFSIGNAHTLRGWNKYEISPLGGNRVVYGSATYKYKIIGGFYDVGSVWESGQSRVIRHSAGVKLGKSRCGNTFLIPHPDCFSVAVGFPISGDKTRPALMLGLGF